MRLNDWQRQELGSLLTATHAADMADGEPQRHHPMLTRCEECASLYRQIEAILEGPEP